MSASKPVLASTWMWFMGAGALGICLAITVMAVAIVSASTGQDDTAREQLPPQPMLQPQLSPQQPAVDTHRILVEDNLRLKKEIDQLQQDNADRRSKLEELQRELDQQKQTNKELQEKVVLIDKWRKATFIVTSKRNSVGIRPTRHGQFQVVATAVFPHTEYVLHVARKLNIPRVFQADQVALKLCEEAASQREFVSEELALHLRKFWRSHKYVKPGPKEDATFVMFKDLETNKNRVGFLLDVSDRSLSFQPVGQSTERILRSQIESGTARKGNADRILAEPEADYLDVCILRLAQRLASEESVPGLMSLAIKVQTDALAEEIERSKSKGTSETREFDYRTLTGLNPYPGDVQVEPIRILRRFAEHLHDEIGSRLGRLGIPVVEREELGAVIAERDLADARSFEPCDYTGLISVSHLVIVDVDKPRNGGDFRVSVRLVDANTGAKIFEDNGDVGRKPAVMPERYMISSGRLALLQGATRGPIKRDRMARLILPNDLRSTPAGRVVLLESAVEKPTAYQELFAHRLQRLQPASAYAELSSLIAENAVPPSQQLRVVAWQLARSILPAAGRVARINENRVTIALSPDHRIQKGDRFQIMRSHKMAVANSDFTPPDTSVLPIRLRADVIADDHVTCYVIDSGLEQLWPDSTITSGDLALREGVATPTAYVAMPRFDGTLLTNQGAAKLRMLTPSQRKRVSDNMGHLGGRLHDSLVNALRQIGIRVVNDPEVATHVVGGGIAPQTSRPNSTRFLVQLAVRHNSSREQLANILPIMLTTPEVESWRP